MTVIAKDNKRDMNNFLKTLLISSLLCATITVNAQRVHFDFTSKINKSKVYYRITDKKNLEAEVTYKNAELGSYKGNVIIADTVRFRGKTYKITSIGDSAFFGCEKIDTVFFADNIKRIGKNAFSLTNVQKIIFNTNLQEIETEAFANCNSIDSFFVTKDIKKVGDFAFESSGLQTLIIESEGIESVRAFNNIPTLQHISIKENVKTLSEYIFDGCDNIQTLIYNAESFIGFSPFENKTSLTHVTIGENVISVPENFVYNCMNVTKIELPENVQSLGSMSFSGTGVSEIVLHNNISQMGIGVFKNCKQLQYVELPENLTVIVDNTFEGCESLHELTIAENLVEIDTAAFKDCKSLTTFVFPKTLSYIGKQAFEGCVSLKKYISEGSNPAKLEDDLYLPNDAYVEIDCNDILTYKNTAFWNNLTYICDMDNVTVHSTVEREVFDKARNRSFTERIINTGNLSYVITNDRDKYVSLIAEQTSYRDDITRNIEIPAKISDGEVIYTVTGIEGLGVCKSVFIPATVKYIDTMVFSGIDLENIEVDTNNPYFASFEGELYSKDMKTLLAYPTKKASLIRGDGQISLLEQTVAIGYGAFSNCKNTDVFIHRNISSIGANQQVRSFIIDKNNTKFMSNGEILFNTNKTIIYSAIGNYTPNNRVLKIDSSVATINDKAFYTAKFDTVIFQTKTPPEIFANTFNLNKTFVCIVPRGSLNAYKNEDFFNQMNIKEQKPIKKTKKRASAKNKKR